MEVYGPDHERKNQNTDDNIKLILPGFSIFDKHLVPDVVLYRVLP